MSKKELLEMLIRNAKEYRGGAKKSIRRNSHMLHFGKYVVPSQDVIDDMLTDFLNFVASEQGIDLALYSTDLETAP